MPTNLSSLHENKTTGEAEAHTSLSPLLVRAQQQREKKTIVLFAVFLAHCNQEPTEMAREEPNFEVKIVLLWVSAGHSGHSCSLLACGSTGAPAGGGGISAAIQHEGGLFLCCVSLWRTGKEPTPTVNPGPRLPLACWSFPREKTYEI